METKNTKAVQPQQPDTSRQAQAQTAEPQPASEKVEVTYEPHVIRRDYCDLKDPGKSVWLVRDTPRRIQQMQKKGYTFVRPDEVKDHDGAVIDNVIRFEDRIAMKAPREIVEEQRKRRELEWKAQEQALEEDADAQARDGYPGEGLTTYPEHGRKRSFNIPIDL